MDNQPIQAMLVAPKDGTPVLIKIKDDLSPWGVKEGDFGNTYLFQGKYAVMRYNGPVHQWCYDGALGRGGFPDAWLDGWWPLPNAGGE